MSIDLSLVHVKAHAQAGVDVNTFSVTPMPEVTEEIRHDVPIFSMINLIVFLIRAKRGVHAFREVHE